MNSSFQRKITNLQSKYYENHNKNRFFKSNQKLECATLVTKSFDVEVLFSNAIYVLPNTNHIYFNYPVFKTFAIPDMFESFVTYVYTLIHDVIDKYSVYEMHVNWNTYSVSAHERYKNLYTMFLARYEASCTNFHDNITSLHVYYTPTIIQVISNLMTPLIHPLILNKIVLHSKSDSDMHINNLLSKTNS
jgi:hypothetical protein